MSYTLLPWPQYIHPHNSLCVRGGGTVGRDKINVPSASKILQQSPMRGKVIKILHAIYKVLTQEPKHGVESKQASVSVG